MLNHYITKYKENGKRWAESWIQLDLFGKCWCFSKKKIIIEENVNKNRNSHFLNDILGHETTK